MRTYTQTKRTLGCIAACMLALWLAACKSGSVMDSASSPSSNTNPNATPAVTVPEAPAANTPAPGSTANPLVLASPSGETVVTTAAGTLRAQGYGANSSNTQPLSADPNARHIGDFPVELSSAKKMASQPDAFPPRPTPVVEMVNGKLKQPWPAPAEALALQNPLKPTPENLAAGREWFNQRCIDCHGKAGKGNGYLGANLKRDGQPLFPTNLASQVVQANSDGELFWKITNGRSPMPANRIRFEEEQRWQMVLYLRTLR